MYTVGKIIIDEKTIEQILIIFGKNLETKEYKKGESCKVEIPLFVL